MFCKVTFSFTDTQILRAHCYVITPLWKENTPRGTSFGKEPGTKNQEPGTKNKDGLVSNGRY